MGSLRDCRGDRQSILGSTLRAKVWYSNTILIWLSIGYRKNTNLTNTILTFPMCLLLHSSWNLSSFFLTEQTPFHALLSYPCSIILYVTLTHTPYSCYISWLLCPSLFRSTTYTILTFPMCLAS